VCISRQAQIDVSYGCCTLPHMVTLEGPGGSRTIYCQPSCIWAWACGDQSQAVEYVPDALEASVCQWCAGCGSNLSPHLGVAGCMMHGERCFPIRRWFLRTRAAVEFCRLVWVRTGEVVEIGNSPLWLRAMQLWSLEQYAGADGLEIFERVMNELAG
jgi:hypothetical protein